MTIGSGGKWYLENLTKVYSTRLLQHYLKFQTGLIVPPARTPSLFTRQGRRSSAL